MSITTSAGVVTNGLVFAYDMANTQKSFEGQPTTNYFGIPTPDSSGNVTFPAQGTGTFQRIYAGTYGGYTIQPTDIVYKYVLGLAPTGCHYHGNTISVTTGQTPTWSFDYYIDGSTTGYPVTNYLANMESSVGVGLALTDPTPTSIGVWKRVTGTSAAATSNGTFNAYLYPGACGTQMATGGFILYKNPQVELNSFATPFTTSTRSTAQAVIDLTNNNTITATSLTYNSNNTFSFNGSTSLLSLPSLNLQRDFTLECWVYLTSSGTSVGFFGQGVYATGQGMHIGWFPGRGLLFGMYANDLECPGYTMTYNTWHHFVYTYNNTTYFRQTFADGVLVASGTLTQYTGSGQFNIGAIYSNASTPFAGNYAVAKAYSRVLSTDEVQQNFNAQRSRFGI